MFVACPDCGSTIRVRLEPDWQDRVNVRHEPIPIVGCGDPWHYQGVGLRSDRTPEEDSALLESAKQPDPPDLAGAVPLTVTYPVPREVYEALSEAERTEVQRAASRAVMEVVRDVHVKVAHPVEVQEAAAREAYLRPIAKGGQPRPVVSCDESCGALLDPETPEELRAAVEHWKDHGYLFGCSHAR